MCIRDREGAIQIFQAFNTGMEEIIVCVVGVLQFDVLKYRLENEYNVDVYKRQDYEKLQEIKVRVEKPVFYFQDGREYMLKDEWGRPYIATKEEVRELLEYVSHYSLYAYEEEMRQGFLTCLLYTSNRNRWSCKTGRRLCRFLYGTASVYH